MTSCPLYNKVLVLVISGLAIKNSSVDILLLNDTNQSFYKYNYKPASVCPEYIKPFIRLSHAGKIVFSHYGDDTKESPALKIYVINEF